jgi:hypothetical protein
MAQGKRIKTPAQVTLSNPGPFQGREVYRCFTLTVPAPATSEHLCLTGPHGGYWYLGPASQPKTTPTQPTSGTYARFYTPSRNIACEMSDNGTAQGGIGCIMQKPPALASLKTSGVATICQHQGLNCTGNLGGAPGLPPPRELPYGSSKTVGRFRCGSEQAGVTCTVIRSGKGFLINNTGITAVGHAGVTPVSPSGQGLTPNKEAVVFSPLAYGLSCNMTDGGGSGGSWVYCWIGGSPNPTHHVKLDLDGQFSVTATTAIPPGLGGRSTPYGGEVTVGRFRCQSLRSGIKCTVVSTGKGFLFNINGATPVG